MFANTKTIQSSFSTIRLSKRNGLYVFKQKNNTGQLFYYSISQNQWFLYVVKKQTIQSSVSTIRHARTNGFHMFSNKQKQYRQAFLLCALPKLMGFICVWIKKQYSQALLLFDLQTNDCYMFSNKKNYTNNPFYYSTSQNSGFSYVFK